MYIIGVFVVIIGYVLYFIWHENAWKFAKNPPFLKEEMEQNAKDYRGK